MGLKALWTTSSQSKQARDTPSSPSSKLGGTPSTRTSRTSKVQASRNVPIHAALQSPVEADASPVSKSSPDPLNKYQILKGRRYDLGRGSFSDVKTAVSIKTGAQVAMKMVKRKYLMNKEEQVMVAREIEIQQRLQHPSIVKLIEVFEDSAHYYLVLEKTNHGSLQQLLANHATLTEVQARSLFTQLASAVQYLHGLSVLHGDLKPENILLHASGTERRNSGSLVSGIKTIAQRISLGRSTGKTGSMPAMAFGNTIFDENNDCANLSYDYDYEHTPIETLEVKLCDFGLARWLNTAKNKRQTGDAKTLPFTAFRGTMGYVAPEILREECCGSSSDVWSLGVILYEILGKGIKPFVPYRNCLDMDVEFPKPIWGDRSPEAVKLITRMLSRDPAKRPTMAQVMESAWMIVPKL